MCLGQLFHLLSQTAYTDSRTSATCNFSEFSGKPVLTLGETLPSAKVTIINFGVFIVIAFNFGV